MAKKLSITISSEPQKRYYIDVLGLFFIALAILVTFFESLPASTDETTIKFLLMTIFGFAFSITLIIRIDTSFGAIAYGLMGIGFGAGLTVLLAMLPQTITPANMTSTQLTLLAPVSEELFFRGFILGIFILIALKINFIELAYIANVPISMIFAWFHCYVYEVELTGIFIPLFLGGIIFGLAFLLTQNLSAAFWSHLFVNFLSLGILGFTIF